MSHRAKANSTSLIGDAGEHFVVAELLRRGWLAALAPRNSTAWDVLATRGGRTVRVRVKTRTTGGWTFNKKPDGALFRELGDGDDDVLVLVALDGDGPPRYWVARTAAVEALARELHAAWLAAPGRGGRVHRDSSVVGLRELEVPAAWRDAWDALEAAPLN